MVLLALRSESASAATCAVRKDASGVFVEDSAWTGLQLNDEQVRLSGAWLP